MRYKYILLLVIMAVVFINPASAKASFFDDFLNKTKEILGIIKPETPSLSIEPSIVLAQDGDINKNNQIDSGDTITFSFKIKNPTNNKITFATLNTNINKSNLNYVTNIKGTPSLTDKGNSVAFPNLKINPYQTLEISFDATVNYFDDKDRLISTEPEIISSDKKSLVKSAKKEIQAKLDKDLKPSMVNFKRK